MKKHLSIRVTGRVQGVFFRASAQKKAHELGIFGFVRNERDGSVFAEAEGDETSLAEFATWMKRGPSGAIVDSCLIEEDNVVNYSDFIIQR